MVAAITSPWSVPEPKSLEAAAVSNAVEGDETPRSFKMPN
jgi:hypothetical protein